MFQNCPACRLGNAIVSSHHLELTLELPLTESLAVCERAASRPGWRITHRDVASIRCIEASQNAFGFTNPAQVTIMLDRSGEATRISLSVSNFGFGPIQSRHVKEQAKLLTQQIEAESGRPTDPETAVIESGSSVFINGTRLSEPQLLAIEESHKVRVPDGRYWYDPVCGAWGLEGGPQCGIAVAGLALGGPLRADASNGNTGVFVNGRELHAIDVARLASLAGAVIPGRWWIDSQGNFGPEGWPMIGNVFALARSRMTTPSHSSSASSGQYGALVSDGSFIGFQGSIGSGVNASSG